MHYRSWVMLHMLSLGKEATPVFTRFQEFMKYQHILRSSSCLRDLKEKTKAMLMPISKEPHLYFGTHYTTQFPTQRRRKDKTFVFK